MQSLLSILVKGKCTLLGIFVKGKYNLLGNSKRHGKKAPLFHLVAWLEGFEMSKVYVHQFNFIVNISSFLVTILIFFRTFLFILPHFLALRNIYT